MKKVRYMGKFTKRKGKDIDGEKKLAGIFLLVLVGMVASPLGIAEFKPVKKPGCTYNATYDCIGCKAPIHVGCTHKIRRQYESIMNHYGFVSRQAELDKLTVLVTSKDGLQKEIVLSNPPGRLGDYIDNLKNNKWVTNQIEKLKPGDKIEVAYRGYGLKSDTKIYNNINADKSFGTVFDAGIGLMIEKCWYTEIPTVIGSKNCGDRICRGSMECSFGGTVYSDLKITCKAKKGVGPSPGPDSGPGLRFLSDQDVSYECPKPDECMRLQPGTESGSEVFSFPARNYRNLGGIVDISAPKGPAGTSSGIESELKDSGSVR